MANTGQRAKPSYQIEAVIFNKLFDDHVPYYIGTLIVGPKGGKYLIDEFNIEQMVNKNIPRKYAHKLSKATSLLQKYGIATKTIQYVGLRADSMDEAVKTIAKAYEAKPIIRLKGKEYQEKYNDSLDNIPSLYDFIIGLVKR